MAISNLVKPNEAAVTATIVSGNPAIKQQDAFHNNSGNYIVELGVTKGSKDEKKVLAAHQFAMDYGAKNVFGAP